MSVSMKRLMEESAVKFGTSGARGLITDMTDRVCYLYTAGFIQYLESIGQIRPGANTAIAVAGDLRPSSPRIVSAVMRAIRDRDYRPINCGFIPSPAVALYGITREIPSIMVTGSHIPDDRNGIKFNRCNGEILKEDEEEMLSQKLEVDESLFDEDGSFCRPAQSEPVDETAAREYQERFLNFFEPDALSGLKIGVYQHSSVSRDILAVVARRLGAEVVLLGRSEKFIPVDTEAIRSEDVESARRWSAEHRLDAIFSADGDGDRPLLADEKGEWFRGDVGGILCARFLGAHRVSTPVNSNTALERSGWFKEVTRTRIGSPYVIGEMIRGVHTCPGCVIVGYEANGGFLQQTPLELNGRTLAALPTRDALIYLLGITVLARESGKTLSELRRELPRRYTCSDRLQSFPVRISQSILEHFSCDLPIVDVARRTSEAFEKIAGKPLRLDYTDGVRISFDSEEIIHLRPSGNAPEFRCYTEADTPERARKINEEVMAWLKTWLNKPPA